MKYIFLLLVSTFVLVSCGSTNKNFNENKGQSLQQLITPQFEKLDTSAFEIMHRRLTYQDTFMRRGDYLIHQNDSTLHELKYSWEVWIPDNRYKLFINIKKIYSYNPSFDLLESNEPIDKYITIFKEFYPNGNIKQKSIGSWLGFSIGKEYFFNKKRKLIKVIDHDKEYDFTFEDVLLFCKKNNIVIKKNTYIRYIVIVKRQYNGEPAWYITSLDSPGRYKTFVVDGKTGILKHTSIRFEGVIAE